MRIAVGLCVKNNERTIKETINSLISQDYPYKEIELIVVDGGSKDRTLEIITSLALKTSLNVKIYYDKGLGLGAARQIVIDNAQSEYIIWIDGDVIFPKNYIRKMVEFMEQNPKVGAAIGKCGYKKGNLIATLQNIFHYAGRRICNEATIFRLNAIKQVGYYDKRIKGASEDTDILFRIKEKGWGISVNQQVEYYHNFKETLKELWDEQYWFGQGHHFLSHKHKGMFKLFRHQIPFLYFAVGVRRSFRAYKLTHHKRSFLLPLLCFFKGIAWFLGFITAHIKGYGHNQSSR